MMMNGLIEDEDKMRIKIILDNRILDKFREG